MLTVIAICSGISIIGGTLIGRAWKRATGSSLHECGGVWGPWEDCQIRSQWRWNENHTEYVPVLVDGQHRECLGCNEKQTRIITPQ